MQRRISTAVLAIVVAVSAMAKEAPKAPPQPARKTPTAMDKRPPLTKETRFQLIRAINAEFAFARKPLPMGRDAVTIKPTGAVSSDEEINRLIAHSGMAARAGDRVQITDIEFKGKKIYLEINGGPTKKKKWYEHITMSGAQGSVSPGSDPNQEQAHGGVLEVVFPDYIPELSGPELRTMLGPVLDFTVKSATEAYIDTLPPKVKESIKNHQVLVGMNKEMVVAALGRAPQKIRERDANNTDYEEWIYGTPPSDVQFVRLVGDEVVQVKIMKIDGTKTVKTEREVELSDSGQAKTESNAPQQRPANAPSLHRPGDEEDTSSPVPGPQNPPKPQGGDIPKSFF